eukprot:CAMPEP_0183756486 /NCGR_PEP_ID=MMETSP0739-20130205/5061_1 /TAXON_ID=385413 /ORGANISM="Thalassiosira miniscula, Strain CCMP1093" /LENGTH=1155 /DNA_ID=CAMNT_0025993693 /DNA_START=45 /DNA_END=3512 /DNA_ORIENTATION=+
MPPESGTIAPEAGAGEDSPPASAPPPADDFDDNHLRKDATEEEGGDNGTVHAVTNKKKKEIAFVEGEANEYIDDEDNDTVQAVTKKKKRDKDIEEGVPATAAASQADLHPPSFFTDHRGNLKAVAFVVRHPCAIFWFLIVLCIVISFLLQAMVFRAAEGNPFTVPTNEFDLKDERSVQYDSYRLAKDRVAASRAIAETDGKQVLYQSELAAIAYWVFEADQEKTSNGVFGSASSIEGMKDAYDIFLDDPEFAKYCVLDYRTPVAANETRKCRAPLTPLAMYYPSEWDEEKAASIIDELKDPAKMELFNTFPLVLYVTEGLYEDLMPDYITPADINWARKLAFDIWSMVAKWDMEGELVPNYQQVTELASYLIQVDAFKGTVDFGFDKGFSAENPVSQYSRGIVFWGAPLDVIESGEVMDEEKEEAVEEADDDKGAPLNVTESGEVMDEEKEEADDDKRKEFIKANYLEQMNKQSEKDKDEEINSYYFMTAIIGDVIIEIVTKDATLAIFSFVFVFIWLRLNTNSWMLAFVGFFEIFFSIPIAWFIFTVIFQIKYFATLNTLAIFIVAAIGADDIFIFMDAYKQSQYHPEILVDLETRMSWVYRRSGTAMAITSATTCAAFLCTLITPLASLQSFGIFAAVTIFIDYVLVMTLFCTAVIIYHNRFENSAVCGCCCPCGRVDPSNTEKARVALEESDGEIKRDRVSEFFRVKVAGFVQKPLNRLCLCIIFLTWLGLAIWQASLIQATKESEQFLDEEHPLQKSVSILDKQFPTADDDLGLKVYYVWGVDEVDRDGVNLLLDPEYYGSPNFVKGFDFNQQCQSDLMDFCDKLKTDTKYQNLIKRKNGVGQVYCFLEELAAYNVKGNLTDCDYVRTGGWRNTTWQVDPNDLPSIMPDFLKQKSCLDENNRETISGRYQEEIGWDGTSLMFVAVAAESSVLDPFGQDAESLTRKEYEQFVAIAKEQDQIVSKSCSGAAIMTDLDNKFVFMNNQSIYVQSAIQSAVLGVAIAFVVLLFSTRVFHIAFFASLSIMSVLVSVVGTMVMLGWFLGSIESTLIGIIAGFSVDYVVHLAHAYEIAKGDTNARVTEAFSDLGISVFNGMITSVVASIPLFFCQLQFFAKFGTFLCLTIAFSWIFANFGFMSLLAQLKIPLKEKGCRL